MPYTDEQKRIAIDYFVKVKSIIKTVKDLGYPTFPSLRRWCREAQIDTSFLKPGTFTIEERLEVLQDYIKNGYDVVKTAEQYNNRPTTSSINNWLRDIINNDQPQINKFTVWTHNEENIDKTRRKYSEVKKKIEETEQLRELINFYRHNKTLTIDDLVEGVDTLLPFNGNNVSYTCEMVGIPRSTYLYRKNRKERPAHYELRIHIRTIFEESYQTYGYRRIMMVLDEMGEYYSERLVRRIMREEGLVPRAARHKKHVKHPITPNSCACPNLIERNFFAEEPGRKLYTDVTQMKVGDKWLYVSTVLDGFDGALVGSSVSLHPNAEFVVESLVKACEFLGDECRGAIIHSDRGALYSSNLWVDVCEKYDLVRSMSALGCCGDNAMMEGYHGIMKNEFWYDCWDQCDDVDSVIEAYNNYVHFYNYNRKKTVLNGLTPIQYREIYYESKIDENLSAVPTDTSSE